MKNLNSNSFFKVCSGIALVTASVALLFFSVNRSVAAPTTNVEAFSKMMPPGASGKYMFSYTVDQAQNGDYFWHLMVWNSETGAFKCFYWDRAEQNWVENFGKALPALP
jgi:hypothetical protein